jgi:hypothetical protein
MTLVHIVASMGLVHTADTMTSPHIVATMTLDTAVAPNVIVAFVIRCFLADVTASCVA